MAHLYERIASELEQSIVTGIYPVGDRLPSLREVRDRFRVSLSTAIEAFAVLEDKGLIEPKPKSGHFVRPRPARDRLPAKTRPVTRPKSVTVVDRVMDVCWAPTKAGMRSLAVTAPTSDVVGDVARLTARVARRAASDVASYPRPEGCGALRAAIGRVMAERSCTPRGDDILVTNGAHEALVLALRATTRPGDVVAVESPTYFGVLQAIEALGLRALELPTDPRRGVDLEALEHAARRGIAKACVLSPVFQNPLGFHMSDADKQAAVEISAEHDVVLIEDDVFGALALDAPGPRPAKSFDRQGTVIYCGSFSKTVSPALRIGWAMAGRFTRPLLREKFLANLGTALVPQMAIAEYLGGNRFRRVTRHAALLYARRLRALRDGVLDSFPRGTRCSDPAGGMVLWIELPASFDATALLDAARRDGISFLPGELFSASGAYRNCLRLSVCAVAEDAIPDVAKRLGALARRCHRPN